MDYLYLGEFRNMIPVRLNLKINQSRGIFSFLNDSTMIDSDRKELIATEKYEKQLSQLSAENILFDDILFKSNFIKIFRRLIPKFELSGKEIILEMGASHGWASVLLKNKYPDCYLVASDLVPDNLQHIFRYEKLLNTNIDEKWAFNCRDIPFKEKTFDRIFTFAAFHHFGEYGNYSKSLEQMIKILKPEGKILLLYEPSSPQYLYKLALKRVSKRKEIDNVDEDILVLANIEKIVKKLGCEFKAELFPFYKHRKSIVSTNYYYLLSKLGNFKRFFICTVNIIIEKK